MAPIPGLLYVTMHPKPSLPPSQFHDWYDNEHGPTRLRLSWCRNGFRYRANDGDVSASKPEWMAIYDISDMHLLTTEEYTRLRAPPVQSQRERDTMKQIDVDRRFYDFVSEWKSDDSKQLEDVENEGEGNVLVAVNLSLHDGDDKEEELRKWYEEEHVPLLQKVPGWRRTRRFVTSYLDLKDGKKKEWLALHEYAPRNGLGGEEFTKATSTRWNDEIYKSVVRQKWRRTYDLYYTFGAAPRDLQALNHMQTQPAESTDGMTRAFPASYCPGGRVAIESYVTTRDGVRLPFRLEGSPEPDAPLLLCINSILVEYGIWDDFIPPFLEKTGQKYRMLRFNARGRSKLPDGSTSPITIETLTADVMTLLDALRVRKAAAVVGVSLGGATALSVALAHPERISAFVSCDTNSLAPPSNARAWGERIAVSEMEDAREAATDEQVVGGRLAEMTVRRWFVEESYGDEVLRERIERVKDMVRTNSLDGFRKSVNALYEYDLRGRMEGFRGKGAFLVGAGDGVLPGTMKGMAGELGGEGMRVQVEVVEGAGHLPMVERPGEVAAFVARFLSQG